MVNMLDQEFRLPSILEQRDSILWHMAKVAFQDCEQSLCLLQETVNHLSANAENLGVFSEKEKSFLVTLFECPWWGGREYGLNQAHNYVGPEGKPASEICSRDERVLNLKDPIQLSLAKMAWHYVHGDGQYYPLSLPIYQQSRIVQDAISALKAYIAELHSLGKPCTFVSSADNEFLRSRYASSIEKDRLQTDVLGFIFNDGTLMLEQKDPRIVNAGNRFKISGLTHTTDTGLTTRWKIEGRYCFEYFDNGGSTFLPLTEDLLLRIPYALSNYMVAMDIAKPFNYFAEWVERYELFKL